MNVSLINFIFWRFDFKQDVGRIDHDIDIPQNNYYSEACEMKSDVHCDRSPPSQTLSPTKSIRAEQSSVPLNYSEVREDKYIELLHHSPALVQSPSPVPCTDINEMSVSSLWSRAGLLTRLQSLSSMSLLPTWINDDDDNTEVV